MINNFSINPVINTKFSVFMYINNIMPVRFYNSLNLKTG